jgi:hypothetical protein
VVAWSPSHKEVKFRAIEYVTLRSLPNRCETSIHMMMLKSSLLERPAPNPLDMCQARTHLSLRDSIRCYRRASG